MFTRSLALAAFALSCFAAVGCSSSEDAEGGGTAPGGSPASDESNVTRGASTLKADIKEVPFRKTLDKCVVDVKQIEVKLSNTAAADSINKELKSTERYKDYFDPTDCKDNQFSLEGGQTAAFNERGWLTVTMGESSYYEGAAHPNNEYYVRNFDLASGKLMVLDDVVDAEGKAILVKACKKELNGEDNAAEGTFDEPCDNAVKTNEYASPAYAIEKEGLRIHALGLGHAAFAMGVEGSLVKWADLKNHIKNPVVKAIAGQ